jgi:hypothetical protein
MSCHRSSPDHEAIRPVLQAIAGITDRGNEAAAINAKRAILHPLC